MSTGHSTNTNSDTDVSQVMPANRDNYDFRQRVPTDIPAYYEHDGEYTRIMADIQRNDRLPRYLIGGPTGCGKTHLAQYVAQTLVWYKIETVDGANGVFYENDIRAIEDEYDRTILDDEGYVVNTAEFPFEEEINLKRDLVPEPDADVERIVGCPLITIQCKYSMSEADLLGMPNIDSDQTYWQDGPATKALIASRDGPVVLLLDEVNRGRPESKSALFSMLDDRAEVTLDGRGGEIVRGIAENLISIGTMNEGAGYFVEEMDLAERRRLGSKFPTDYLGKTAPQKEMELLIERTDVHSGLAELMVEAANSVRENLAERDSSSVRTGIPTGMLLAWAESATGYANADIDNPVMEAATDAIIRPFYGGEDGEHEVREALASHVDEVPFDADEFAAFTADENDQTDGNSPDNAANAEDMSNYTGDMDVADAQQQIEAGTDPHELLDRGVDEDVVMKAMAQSTQAGN